MSVTLEGGQVAAELQHFLKGLIVLLVGLLHVDSGEGVVTPSQQFLPLCSVLTVRDEFEIHVPDVEIEDE